MVKSICYIVLCLALPFGASAVEINPTGDFRAGFFYKKNGDSEFRFRLRAGVKAQLGQNLSAKFRLSGRTYVNGKNNGGFNYFSATPAYSDTIPAGQTTIDTISIKYKFSESDFIRIGRFQSKYELMGVAKKSLDRNNSPNTDITWIDGLHLSMALGGHHQLNAILQYNPENGTTVLREPLHFKESKSRISYFLGIQHAQPSGPLVQREIGLTIMPSALCKSGLNINKSACSAVIATTYTAAVARMAAQWPVMNARTKFLLSTEIGYSPTRPNESVIGGNLANSASGLAYQVTFNFIDFLPKHSIGFVYGKAGGGWLISPDLSSNNTLKEVRYAWKLGKKQKLELRFRERDSIVGAKRSRKDSYLRYTIKY
jgi:hypothetical protein